MRLFGCYFDKCDVLLEDPHALIITASSFYGNASVIVKPTTANTTIDGLRITDNTFRCAPSGKGAGCGTVRLDTTQGSVGAITGTTVAGNYFEDPKQERSTEATRVAAAASADRGDTRYTRGEADGSEFEVDFSAVLLFPGLEWREVQYSVEIDGDSPLVLPCHARAKAQVGRVRVVTDTAAMSASISVKQ
jgi:hypothetical protein